MHIQWCGPPPGCWDGAMHDGGEEEEEKEEHEGVLGGWDASSHC